MSALKMFGIVAASAATGIALWEGGKWGVRKYKNSKLVILQDKDDLERFLNEIKSQEAFTLMFKEGVKVKSFKGTEAETEKAVAAAAEVIVQKTEELLRKSGLGITAELRKGILGELCVEIKESMKAKKSTASEVVKPAPEATVTSEKILAAFESVAEAFSEAMADNSTIAPSEGLVPATAEVKS